MSETENKAASPSPAADAERPAASQEAAAPAAAAVAGADSPAAAADAAAEGAMDVKEHDKSNGGCYLLCSLCFTWFLALI